MSSTEPGDLVGVQKALAFISGEIDLIELNQWALAYASDPTRADRDSHVIARLICVLYATYGVRFISPLIETLRPITESYPTVSDGVMRVALEFAAADPSPPQA